MFKYFLQLLVSSFLLLFSTLAAWYEGSGIIENSLEWNYSTPFTQFLGIEIITGKEIVVFDYFVYALKFQPFFPMLMLLSLLYIFGFILFWIGKLNIHLARTITFAFGLLCLVASTLFFNSTTVGGILFFYILLISAIVIILISIYLFIQNRKKQYLIEKI